ncbi:LysR family transcriptional regulator [Mesorhizobium sp. M0437]|uniref:LysR family transcriptional regulator n=1 Tax=Mesorhizobium sp. M0437 TaxID=2956945 RepID=UPI003335F482
MESANLQGIVAFVHAVEAGSFTGAGARLHVTKSAVGKSIAQLEQRLGVRLLNRTTRSLSPTSEGLSYYEACVRALAEIDAAQSLLASRKQVPSGRLRVDLPLAFGRRCVAPVLFDISKRYPDLTMEISFNDRRVDLIEEGIDLTVRMGDLDDSLSLAARRIYAQRSGVCAAPAYLDAHGRPQSIEDLARHSLIGYGRDGTVHPWTVRHADGRLEKFAPKARLVLGHGEPMLDAVLAGCGIVYLPTWLTADSIRRGELEMVLSDSLVENTVVHAIWPVTRNLAPKVRVVVDALIEHFAAPPWDVAGVPPDCPAR